jgi:DNA-binding transcriptional LysR family regulator
LEPEDLRRHALLLIGSPRSRTALRLTGPGREALITASPRLLSSDPAVVVQAALAGAGIGQAPRILVQSILDSGLLVPVLRDWASPAADISLLFASHRPLPSRVRVFIDYLRSGIRKA